MKKLKYWYRTDIEICIECGKEMISDKYRVYNFYDAGKRYIYTLCNNCRLQI
jgi:predicted RNA-binding Zn-ribbon protein involved in translation (DUF1610 family)